MIPIFLQIFEGGFVRENLLEGPIIIARSPHTDQITDTAHCDSGFEALSVADNPYRHIATITTTGDSHAFWVDIWFLSYGISPGHQIRIIGISPTAPNGFSMIFTVTSTSAGIAEMDHITVSGEEIKFVHEQVSILG